MVIAIVIIIAVSLGNSMGGIEIVGEQLVTDPYYTVIGDNLYPIVVVKVKNTSNTTKKVSFEVNFYADGNLLGSDQASYITLAPGDEAFLHAQSDRVLSRILLQDHQVACLLIIIKQKKSPL